MTQNDVSSPDVLARKLRSLLTGLSEEQLGSLVTGPDPGIALMAGWERMRKKLPQRDNGRSKEDVSLGAVARFLGLVEGLTRASLPPAWEHAVYSVRSRKRGDIWFSLPTASSEGNSASGLGDTASVTREHDRWIIMCEGRRWSFPVEAGSSPVDHAAMLSSKNRTFFALYGWPPVPFTVVAFDNSTSDRVWSAKVWAAGDFTEYSGRGRHEVDFRLCDDNLLVFGASEGAIYVEAFNSNTGVNQYRFSSIYTSPLVEQ